MQFTIKPITHNQGDALALAHKNCSYMSPIDHDKLHLNGKIKIGSQVLEVEKNDKVNQGEIEIGLYDRELLGVLPQDKIPISKFNDDEKTSILEILDLNVNLFIPNSNKKKIVLDKQETKELEIIIRKYLKDRIINHSQKFVIKTPKRPYVIQCQIKSGLTQNIHSIDEKTIINLQSQSMEIPNLSGLIFQNNFSLNDLGVGGLDKEFITIFRRAFASRALPRETIEGLGIKHVKGMVFYGPPGCGKTLLARELGEKVLKAKTIKIVTGPSLLSKYVGESERVARELFDNAINDPDKDNLHLIIMDEADALLKKRGMTKDNTGVSDNIVNTILAMIDGPKELSNIMVICMTNRIDMIDEAILRSGRLEIQVEIGLPNLSGRCDILKIHTKKMINNGFTSPDIDLKKIAEETTGYTGADLESVIKNATSLAISRQIAFDKDGRVKVDKKEKPCITQKDLETSLVDITPTFGNQSDELNLYTRTQFVRWNSNLELMHQSVLTKIRGLREGNITSLLVTGKSHTGKTKFLCNIAKKSHVTCVKIVTPEKLAHVGINDRPSHILNMFEQCCRVQDSLLILDGFERLIRWNKLGSRFDNDIVQVIMTIIRSYINPTRKLTVMISCNDKQILKEVGLLEMIDDCNYVMPKNMNKIEAGNLLNELFQEMSIAEKQSIIARLFDEQSADGDDDDDIMDEITKISESLSTSEKTKVIESNLFFKKVKFSS